MNYYKYCKQKRNIKHKQIIDHLETCDDLFEPKLSQKINIIEYSSKIYLNAELFVFFYNKQIVALVACYLNDFDNYIGYITNVSVIKEHQKKGLSKQLLYKCIEYAKKKNFRKIILQVDEKNIIAIKVYSDLGFFRIEGTQDKMIINL